MVRIALERIDNTLLLPLVAAEEDYVLTQGQDKQSWFVLTEAYNLQLLQQLANHQPSEERPRLLLMMQGTYLPLERQGNLLFLPPSVCSDEGAAQFF
jgi:hypothetical protein